MLLLSNDKKSVSVVPDCQLNEFQNIVNNYEINN